MASDGMTALADALSGGKPGNRVQSNGSSRHDEKVGAQKSCLWEFICRKVPHSCPDVSLPGESTNAVEERQHSEARAGGPCSLDSSR